MRFANPIEEDFAVIAFVLQIAGGSEENFDGLTGCGHTGKVGYP